MSTARIGRQTGSASRIRLGNRQAGAVHFRSGHARRTHGLGPETGCAARDSSGPCTTILVNWSYRTMRELGSAAATRRTRLWSLRSVAARLRAAERGLLRQTSGATGEPRGRLTITAMALRQRTDHLAYRECRGVLPPPTRGCCVLHRELGDHHFGLHGFTLFLLLRMNLLSIRTSIS